LVIEDNFEDTFVHPDLVFRILPFLDLSLLFSPAPQSVKLLEPLSGFLNSETIAPFPSDLFLVSSLENTGHQWN
jgi:hypothetical protein